MTNKPTDAEIINIGDVCIYSYFEENRSISIVEVVKELSEETVVIKFHQVIFDNSGNDLFFYLCKTGRTMNASKKYLRKIDLINRLKVENEALISAQETLKKHIAEKNSVIESLRSKGEWTISKMGDGEKVRTCSNCHISQTVNVYKNKVMFNYCPYCGAKMNGR